MELLKKTEEHEQFIFHDKQINHIEDLIAVLKEANDEEYSKYADSEKNDFANWIEHVLNSKDVADKIRTSESKEDTIKVLEEAVTSRKEVATESKDEIISSEPLNKPVSEKTPKEKIEDSMPAPAELNLDKPPAPTDNPIETEKEVKPEEKSAITQPSEPIQTPEENPIEPPKLEEPKLEEPKLGQVQGQDLSKPEIEDKHESAEEPNITEKSDNSTPEPLDPSNIDGLAGTASSVVAPINNMDPNKVQDGANPANFCEHHFMCARKEFLIGLGIGIVIGVIGLQLIRLLIS
ncbi:hypothetical protein C0585_04400 [Candidatus Woesearchaeota archaeon]|nr:MAG: hypothetical protein C0585_04400 [Candidatus Woesearchaeota archaeon]